MLGAAPQQVISFFFIFLTTGHSVEQSDSRQRKKEGFMCAAAMIPLLDGRLVLLLFICLLSLPLCCHNCLTLELDSGDLHTQRKVDDAGEWRFSSDYPV
jgi:hypothetical protein